MRNPNNSATVWSIAGFDPSSGAGVTADLMTFAAHGLFGCSAITALTAQSTLGVQGTQAVPADFLAQTLATLEQDLPPAGIKIGMLSTPELMRVVAQALQACRVDNVHLGRSAPIVVLDPILHSSSGHELYPRSGLPALMELLMPLVDVVTPNWSELAALTGVPVKSREAAEQSARTLMAILPKLHVVVTGGDQPEPVDILAFPGMKSLYFGGEHITSKATHGTGCAFSSAVLANLVLGRDLTTAVPAAKAFVGEAIRQAQPFGHGKGPMNLLWPRPLPGRADDAA